MSYDLYCYASALKVPDLEEAHALIESFQEQDEAGQRRARLNENEKLARALVEYDPRLSQFRPDEGDRIELYPSNDEPGPQIELNGDHVFLNFPYGYKGEEADRVFSQLSGYLRIIRRVSGFFAYDPQTDTAFDPEQTNLPGSGEYAQVTADLPRILSQEISNLPWTKKPWWKLW